MYRFLLTGSTFKRISAEKIDDNIEYFGVFRKGVNEEDHAMIIYHDSVAELLQMLENDKK